MVYTKRNLWFYNNGKEVFTFATEAEANAKAGIVDYVFEEEELDNSEEE